MFLCGYACLGWLELVILTASLGEQFKSDKIRTFIGINVPTREHDLVDGIRTALGLGQPLVLHQGFEYLGAGREQVALTTKWHYQLVAAAIAW